MQIHCTSNAKIPQSNHFNISLVVFLPLRLPYHFLQKFYLPICNFLVILPADKTNWDKSWLCHWRWITVSEVKLHKLWLFQDLLAALRQRVLEFTRRLHRAEVDRHSLHTQLLQLAPRHNGVVEILDGEDRQQTHLPLQQVSKTLFLVLNLHLKWLLLRVGFDCILKYLKLHFFKRPQFSTDVLVPLLLWSAMDLLTCDSSDYC